MKEKPRPIVDFKSCKRCGEVFGVTKEQKGLKVFCSDKCSRKYRMENPK